MRPQNSSTFREWKLCEVALLVNQNVEGEAISKT
jgi:hypothetical protein